ncbi:TonB-dependent receptor [Flavobacterium akiainvivens]|uniref:TonB-dependent receptor n=1 Tax=Flavobacterium akiainvivens TaxID=1202724 RepID=A0A0M8M9U6_9FLAO|nr:TonB-dependent receptor [Flavobacterium akiainvivens]KOS06583.1 TonB-dependent receptor [Flavobacterium akiainvivens]SFQ09949.1 TonB-dependent receptor [Flavobacterium akiainvivens]
MIKKLLLFAVFFSALATYAQKGVISGKITDLESNFSLPGATVRIADGNRYTVSNQIGDYEFLNVPEGSYTVEVVYMGYQTQTQEVSVEAGKTAVLNFIMGSDAQNLEEVIIVGDRLKGQARALNQQKNNQNITNVISSDQVGRFPDSNIGDALKRVPGITMQNDQGEARNIIIRGLAPALNSVTINGDRIPSAEGDNRNVQMDLIPSDMIATMEVNKTLTPDMDADAIGGSVNLITRAAPNGERISATLAGGYAPIRENPIYTAGLVYGNRYLDNKLGVVVSASYNNNDFGSDNVEAVWVQDDFGNTYVEEMDIRKYDVQRIRRSAALAMDYKFNENNTIYLNAMYNWRDDRENRFRTTYDDIEVNYAADGETIDGFTGRVKRETKGGVNNSRNKSRRLEDQRVQNYSVRGEHLLTPGLDMDWQVNYAKAREFRPGERYIEFEQEGLDFTQNITNPERPFIGSTGEDVNEFAQSGLTENRDDTQESEFGAKLNFRFALSAIEGQKGRIRTGLRVRIKDKDRNNIFYSYEPVGDAPTLGQVGTSFFGGDGYNPGSQYVPGIFASASYLGNLNLNNTSLFTSELDPSEFLAVNYTAKENIYAGYIRWDQDITSKLSVIVGARIENTHIDYTGNRVLDEEELEGTITNTNSYTNILPNLQFKYNATDDFILRAAFTTALARPDYYALAPYVNNIAADTEIIAGNPALDATYSYNFDFMAENYFKSVGLVSGGFFYKKLNDFIYNYSNNQYTTADFANDFPGQANPVPAGENWTFLQSRNGESVDVYGFEVAFQRQLDFLPGFLRHFGIYTNYTYTDSKAKGIASEDGDERNDVSLPGTAPHMFNGSLFWDNNRFSARVSVNYAADYLDELGADAFQDSYYDKQTFLDVNASFKITDNIRIFAEANNLTNQPLRYYQGVSSRTKQVEFYEGRFNLGLKFDF